MKNLQLTNEEYNAVEVAIDHLVEFLTDSIADGGNEEFNLQPKLDATLRVRRKLRKPTFVKSHGVSYLAQNDNPWKEPIDKSPTNNNDD